MSRDWKFVKLKDVCQVVTGSTPKTNIPEYWDGEYPWVTPAELKGEKYIQDTERHITDEAVAHTNLTLMPVGTVLLSSRAPIGKVAITETEMYCNQGFKNLICSDKIDNQYLYLWLSSQTEYLNSLGRGATFKEISKTIVENIEVPLTSIEKQHRIVAELNKIKELLDLKCKQLEIYDKLAQSLFYEMFGDPVTNEKGWDVKKVIDVVTLQRGFDLPTQNRVQEGNIPVYGSNGILSFHNESKIENGIITGRSGTIGKVYISETPCWPLNTTLFSKDTHGNNLIYLSYLLRFFDLTRFVEGAGVPTLNRNNFHNKNIISPPVQLQELFAQRIEAIEKQKTSVRAAIEKLETLLNSRMDYWFVIQPVAEEIVENYLSES